ncbi:hypothetical protein AD35_1307 [Escherichia coli 7-233-03_S4_C3]|nr:hypothetical protein AD35_1307 [Escherichia coli 7-233-03_S4_C3]
MSLFVAGVTIFAQYGPLAPLGGGGGGGGGGKSAPPAAVCSGRTWQL